MNKCWVPAERRPYLGPVLKLICKDKGVSLRWLARSIGVNENSIYNYVRGTVCPTSPIIEAICDKLDVSADQLLGRAPYVSDRWQLIGDEVVRREY